MDIQHVSNGRVLGAILLIAGCCIGAGMLGLPVLTALGGFRPTLVLFVVSWLFMAVTGLLLLEVNLWFKEEANIVTMAQRTLGVWGKIAGIVLYVFLFYSLLVAYTAGSGQLFSDFLKESFNLSIPEGVCSLFLAGVFGLFLYAGTRAVDQCNKLLMAGLIATYVLLLFMGAGHVKKEYLMHADATAALFSIPVMIISFGYHNLVPSLSSYLKYDVRKIRFSILVGSAIPLVFYVLWEWLILGIVPIEGGFQEALDQGDMATRALRLAAGSSWVVTLAEYFAFFAIITSFLSVALSFVDFLADGLKVKKDARGKVLLCVLSLLPPYIFSLIYPKIFLNSLSYAGAFGAVMIFGVMPAAMVWSGRYRKGFGMKPLVPGGKVTLVLVMFFALAVAGLELVHQLY